jgi:hypothetical protein
VGLNQSGAAMAVIEEAPLAPADDVIVASKIMAAL